ncbi:MAG: hypothetical protein ACF8QF_00855 [Phycisphaerales bacterium]
MTAEANIETRIATPDDAAPLREAFGDAPAFRRLFEGDAGVLVIVGEQDGRIVGAVAAESSGHPVDSSWAWISAEWPAEEAPDVALYRGAAEAFDAQPPGTGSAAALAAPVAVGDRQRARALEAAGFRPRGGAYRPIGPGMVEYLDGYTDPQGFVVDFVRDRPESA